MELASVCLLPKNHPSSKYANAKQKITFVNAFHTHVVLYIHICNKYLEIYFKVHRTNTSH